jgi:hypothetical protein
MRPASTLLNETSMLSDSAVCVRVPETSQHAETLVDDEPANGLAIDDTSPRLIEPMVAPELIARVRAMLRAMKITTMRRSRLDAQ